MVALQRARRELQASRSIRPGRPRFSLALAKQRQVAPEKAAPRNLHCKLAIHQDLWDRISTR